MVHYNNWPLPRLHKFYLEAEAWGCSPAIYKEVRLYFYPSAYLAQSNSSFWSRIAATRLSEDTFDTLSKSDSNQTLFYPIFCGIETFAQLFNHRSI